MVFSVINCLKEKSLSFSVVHLIHDALGRFTWKFFLEVFMDLQVFSENFRTISCKEAEMEAPYHLASARFTVCLEFIQMIWRLHPRNCTWGSIFSSKNFSDISFGSWKINKISLMLQFCSLGETHAENIFCLNFPHSFMEPGGKVQELCFSTRATHHEPKNNIWAQIEFSLLSYP